MKSGMIARTVYLALAAMTGVCCTAGNADRTPADYVDPFIGTGFHGHTYPGATTPFGMVQLSPDTRSGNWDACAGYHYSDRTLDGFSHTHLSGTGCADLADLLFRPLTGKTAEGDTFPDIRPAVFSHDDETASCGYYKVRLKEEGILVELTAMPRTGVHRYTFEKEGPRRVLIDMMHTITSENVKKHEIAQVSENEIAGMRLTDGWVDNQHLYFSAYFSAPVVEVQNEDDARMLVTFSPDIKTLTVVVGISAVSVENARENRRTEVPEPDFDRVKAEAEELWKEALGDIRIVKGGDEDQLRTFYTAQYHAKTTPNLMSDVNGEYRRSNGEVARLPEGEKYYSTFSIWDTFRAWHPLQTLVDTAFVSRMIRSLLEMYDATGELPIWPLSSGETGCMIGYHSASIIADAYMKGIRGFDAEHALEAMVRSSRINRKGSDYYAEYGFIPANIRRESVSCLLEFAYDDWAIARMAGEMGRQDIRETYSRRAQNYVNVYDGATGFFRGRNLDGLWSAPFVDWRAGRDYTEASPWQYRFFVPHDVYGMIQLFGGREAFTARLDSLFTRQMPEEDLGVGDITGLIGQYAHGNEPSHHMAYLYNWAGQPWKTQRITRHVLETMYKPTPEGILGNEDCGQMSAWYILSALGFYSVCPGSNEFVLTTPLFDRTELRLANGKTLSIVADNPAENRYIKAVRLNGKSIDRTFLTYDEIMAGGELAFELTRKPDPEWGTAAEAAPYSQTTGPVASIPYCSQNLSLFTKPEKAVLGSMTEGASIHYTLDGTEPTEASPLYTEPILIDRSLPLKAKAFKEGMAPSRTMSMAAEKAVFLEPVGKPEKMEPGVSYDYYEGSCQKVRHILSKRHIRSGVMPEPSIKEAPQKDYFAYIFKGYLYVPETGIWTFLTRSDNGTILEINGKEVVNNDGSHPAVTATGRAALRRGYYRYRLSFFEDWGDECLLWGWKAPGKEKITAIPRENLFAR